MAMFFFFRGWDGVLVAQEVATLADLMNSKPTTARRENRCSEVRTRGQIGRYGREADRCGR